MKRFTLLSFIISTLMLGYFNIACSQTRDAEQTPPTDQWEEAQTSAALSKITRSPATATVELDLTTDLNLDRLIELARSRNPEIIALRHDYQASRYRVQPAQALDDPMLKTVVFAGNPIETRSGPQQAKVGLSQKLPWPGKRGLKADMAKQDAAMAQQRMLAVEDNVIAMVKTAYYNYYYISAAIKINKENLEILKGFEQVTMTKYTTGKASQQDVLKAQVEISTIENKLITLTRKRNTAIASINSLLNININTKLPEPAALVFESFDQHIEALYNTASFNRPELLSVEFKIEKSNKAIALAKKNFKPDFTLGIDYTFVEGGTNRMFSHDGQDAIAFGFGMNLPFANTEKRENELYAAKAKLRSAQSLQQALINKTLYEVKSTYENVKAAQELAALFKTAIIPQAEQSLNIAQKQYEAGSIDFLNLLDSQRKLLSFKLSYQQALADYYKHKAMLEKATGKEFTERKD